MSKKTLLAGPYLGEFGCELFTWQAHLRWLSRKYKRTYVICQEGHECLYDDFAICDTLPKSKEADKWKTPDIDMVYAHNAINYQKGDTDGKLKAKGFRNQEFVKYGEVDDGTIQYDVVIHARDRKGVREEDNWGKGNYMRLVDKYMDHELKVCFIGSPKAATFSRCIGKYPPDDNRGIPLTQLCSILRTAKVVVGTSSGPMHLAALCGAPLVVFTGKENHNRYEKHWNPFKVPVKFPKGGWHPSFDAAYSTTMRMLDNG